MSARAIREHDGKLILSKYIPSLNGGLEVAKVEVETKSTIEGQPETIPATLQGSLNTLEAGNLSDNDVKHQLEGIFTRLESQNPWLISKNLVVKPDQLIKRRGKGGLISLNCSWTDVKSWIVERAGKEIQVNFIEKEHLNHFEILF